MAKEYFKEGIELLNNKLATLYKACCFQQKPNKREYAPRLPKAPSGASIRRTAFGRNTLI